MREGELLCLTREICSYGKTGPKLDVTSFQSVSPLDVRAVSHVNIFLVVIGRDGNRTLLGGRITLPLVIYIK